jgi:lycopene beta-cyclase
MPTAGFLGAGLSGLSMACALKRRLPHWNVCLLDPRGSYANDRTFGYFRVHSHPFEALVSRRYTAAKLYSKSGEVRRLDLRSTPYEVIESGTLYTHCWQELATATVAELPACDVVFDSRPPELAPGMWQVFFGGEIELTEPINMDVAHLMDFRIADQCQQADGVRFVYLLPLGPKRALIQDTFFIADRAHPTLLNAQQNTLAILDLHLRRYYQTGVAKLLRREDGALPMQVHRASAQREQACWRIPLGTRAGWLRAATGYSFLETQRGVAKLADWCEGARLTAPILRTRPAWLDCMDTLFLRAICRQPQDAADWFFRMFAEHSSSHMVRFLAGTGSAGDAFAVARSLAMSSFLPSLVRR